nr:uncharacterized protein LOC122321564 [Drosophila bipectinata]
MRLFLFTIFVVFVNGLKYHDIPNLLVNVTEQGSAWVSFPEENIKSVFFSIKRNDTCQSYDYKCDSKEVHPWAIHEFLNETLTIDAILETKQNETIIGSFKVKTNGASEKQKSPQPVRKIIKLPLNSSQDISC